MSNYSFYKSSDNKFVINPIYFYPLFRVYYILVPMGLLVTKMILIQMFGCTNYIWSQLVQISGVIEYKIKTFKAVKNIFF